jgi:GTP-binding protein
VGRFAKSGKKIRMEWFGFTKEYFLERDQLVMVLLLVDASIPPQQADVECLNWLADAEVPVSVVFTKMDKKKKKCPKNSENILGESRSSLPTECSQC